jgi:hypothetical protein
VKEVYDQDRHCKTDKEPQCREYREDILKQIPEPELDRDLQDNCNDLGIFVIEDQIGCDHPEQDQKEIGNDIFDTAVHSDASYVLMQVTYKTGVL